jgi:hypothetical protein
LTETLRRLLEVPAAHDPDAGLELALLDIVLKRDTPPVTLLTEPIAVKTEEIKKPVKAPEPETITKEPEPSPAPPPEADKPAGPVTAATSAGLNEELWQEVLTTIKQKHNTLYSVTRMAVPIFHDDKVTLCFKFPFHQKRISEAKNRQTIIDIIEQVTGKQVSLDCILDKAGDHTLTAVSAKPKAKDTDPLDTISNIFGGGEVLES